MCGLYVIACIPPSGEKGAVPEARHDPLDPFPALQIINSLARLIQKL